MPSRGGEMYGKGNLPAWGEWLVNEFDVEPVAIGARRARTAMFIDTEHDVGLHVDFSSGQMELELGGSSWCERQTGSVRSETRVVAGRMHGKIGEATTEKHRRRKAALEETLDSEAKTLMAAWLSAFGQESIREDERSRTLQAADD